MSEPDSAPAEAVRTGSFVATAAVFLFVGPILLDVVLAIIWQLGWMGEGGGLIVIHNMLEALAWGGAIILFAGFLPIVVCGIGLPLLSTRLKSTPVWLASCTVLGAVLTLGLTLVRGGGDFTEIISQAWVFLACGGGAALASALISDRFRPRSVRQP